MRSPSYLFEDTSGFWTLRPRRNGLGGGRSARDCFDGGRTEVNFFPMTFVSLRLPPRTSLFMIVQVSIIYTHAQFSLEISSKYVLRIMEVAA